MGLIDHRELVTAEAEIAELRAMGKPGENDTLFYDIRLGENGVVTLNGIPMDQLARC